MTITGFKSGLKNNTLDMIDGLLIKNNLSGYVGRPNYRVWLKHDIVKLDNSVLGKKLCVEYGPHNHIENAEIR